jgi:hypothetical protein
LAAIGEFSPGRNLIIIINKFPKEYSSFIGENERR